MPVYDYRCADCGRVTSVLLRSFNATPSPVCARCQGTSLTKLVSRFAVLRSESARLDDLADPSSLAGIDEDDPKSVARWARKMGSELGEDLGDDFREAVDEMESGGDLGGEGVAGPDGFGEDGA